MSFADGRIAEVLSNTPVMRAGQMHIRFFGSPTGRALRYGTTDIGPSVYADLATITREVRMRRACVYRCVVCHKFNIDRDRRRAACPGACAKKRNATATKRRRREATKRAIIDACKKCPLIWQSIRRHADSEHLPSRPQLLVVDSIDFPKVSRAFALMRHQKTNVPPR
jgi:hypothetical protein